MTAGKKIPTEITISPPVTLRITKNYQNDGRKLPGGKFPGELAPATREFFPSIPGVFSLIWGNYSPRNFYRYKFTIWTKYHRTSSPSEVLSGN